jgi:hypothetical protein
MIAGDHDLTVEIPVPWEQAAPVIVNRIMPIEGVQETRTVVAILVHGPTRRIATGSRPGADGSRSVDGPASSQTRTSENRRCSSVNRSSSTSVAPCSASQPSRRSTRRSGADAPLVRPTTSALSIHAGSTSVSSSTR